MSLKTTHVSLFRPEYGAMFAQELRSSGMAPVVSGSVPPSSYSGSCWQAWSPQRGESPAPLVFEQQRLPDARYLPEREPGMLAARLGEALEAAGSGPCTTHVVGADKEGRATLRGMAQTVYGALAARGIALAASPTLPGHDPLNPPAGSRNALQVLLIPNGAWWSLAQRATLPSPFPGGISDLSLPREAPARSYLKVAEALRTTGWRAKAMDRVVDLGAAPGGWSFAFLQRGCRVLAVDNGPMKIPGLDDLPGELTHLREDGLRFTPPAAYLPVDWMLSDMLVPPGVCLGLLRKWIERGWMQRFIVNMKIPQRHPLTALEPMRAYLAEVPGLSWRIRQLYHDRREVTLMGAFEKPPRPSIPEGRRAGESKRPSGRAPRPGGGQGRSRKGKSPQRKRR